MSSLDSKRGYYLIDNTSVGLPKQEYNTWTCKHCQGQVVASVARKRSREVCFGCMRVVCDRCKAVSDRFGCQPFEMIAESVLSGNYIEDPEYPGLVVPRRIVK